MRGSHLTMRLSDAGFHQRRTKALYPHHRSPPWLTEDAARDRSNRLLENSLVYAASRNTHKTDTMNTSITPAAL